MRAAHGQRCTTNHLLVPQKPYKNIDRFGLLNLQTAQLPSSFGCEESQKSFSRDLHCISPRSDGSKAHGTAVADTRISSVCTGDRESNHAGLGGKQLHCSERGPQSEKGFLQSTSPLEQFQPGLEQNRWQSPTNPDRQAKPSTAQQPGTLPSMNSHFKGPTCSDRLPQPPEKVPWGDAPV